MFFKRTSRGSLTLTPNGIDRVNLSWNEVDRANNYEVYSWSKSGGMQLVASLASGISSTTVDVIDASETQWFYIKALNDGGSIRSEWYTIDLDS